MTWIPVNCIEDVPEGNWLVAVETTQHPHSLPTHSALVHKNLSIIGGRFSFDMPRVIAYQELPIFG